MELVGARFGHIHVTEVVGQGGVGEVYGGYDEKLERKVAVKALSPEQRLDDEARERLVREARALSRLDHPNICRIHDYVETPTADLLILEFIDGRTLTDVTEKLSRGEKLRIARDVASGLVAAHRAGIVHRDLKPDNVMITRTGEVKILDFGLARWLGRARVVREGSDRYRALQAVPAVPKHRSDTLPLPPTRYRRGAPLATAVGVTLGTPLFMSPEQARGDELTPASDMFAFGLLLQFLFTGAEPHPEHLDAREIILRVSRGETDSVHGASRDVAALINRLKQFAPADRPTAVETLERLQRMANKPQRIARNAALATFLIVLAIGGWRYTVDLQTERAKAVAAQQEAERRRAQVEGTIEFMLGDLGTKLEKLGRLDVLDDVGQRALGYFESLDPKTMTPESLARSAKAVNLLCEVRAKQGKSDEALALANRSLVLTNEALRRDPHNGEVLVAHGASHYYIGDTLLRGKGRYGEALRHMREYMKDGDALAKLDPLKKEYQLERAYGHSAVASVFELEKNYKDALAHYRVSLQVKEGLVRRDPDDVELQAELARALNKVGAVLFPLGDIRGARDHAKREVAIYRTLVARDPEDMLLRARLATSMAYLGRILAATGDRGAAFALWQEELTIVRELAHRDPANVKWQRNVSATLHRLAFERLQGGDRTGAMIYCDEARRRIAEIRANDPRLFVTDAASIDVTWARLRADAGDIAAARTILEGVIASMEPLAGKDRFARYIAANAAFTLGEISRDRRAAEEAWRTAEEILAPLIPTSTEVTDLDLWVRILVRRDRGAEAKNVLAKIRKTGYATNELEAFLQ